MAWGTTNGSKKIFIKTIEQEWYSNHCIICKGFPQPGTLVTLPPGVQYSPMKTWRYLSSWMTWSITTRMDMHTTSQLRLPSHIIDKMEDSRDSVKTNKARNLRKHRLWEFFQQGNMRAIREWSILDNLGLSGTIWGYIGLSGTISDNYNLLDPLILPFVKLIF